MEKDRRFLSLQWKIFLLIMLILVLPMVVCGMFFYRQNAERNRKQAETANFNIIEQKGMMLEYVFDSIQQNSLRMYQSETVRDFLLAESREDRLHSYIRLNESIQNTLAYDKNIAAVDIIRLDGEQYRSNPGYITGTTDVNTGRLTYAGISWNRYLKEDEAYIFARKIHDINDLGRDLGLMRLYVPKKKLQEILKSEQNARFHACYIVEQGEILIASSVGQEGTPLPAELGGMVQSREQGVGSIRSGGEEQLVSWYHLDYPDWQLVNVMTCEQIQSQNQVFSQMLFLTMTLAILLCGGLAFATAAHVLSPLRKVTRAMKNLEKEDFRIEVPVKGHDEISVLASSFNKMSRKLDVLVNQVHVAQMSEKNAQIKALQAYINPHFLYNTLDVICWMARMEEAAETCRLVEALSKLFRTSVHTGTRVFTVAEELEYTENYLTIQKCRYADSIDFVLDVEPGLQACETISFVLQPLIENAITHGMEQGEGGTIRVSVKKEGDRLVYLVEDDGQGGDTEELQRLLSSYKEGKRGMAISSVHNRIRLYYGEDYGLRFEKHEPRGIRAVVEQPYSSGRRRDDDPIDDCR
ncbi:MAG: sensor histidine kinase [Eubacteriales bacterium]|nr:sensor histidine kinase [Eubacteriales bacterium]